MIEWFQNYAKKLFLLYSQIYGNRFYFFLSINISCFILYILLPRWFLFDKERYFLLFLFSFNRNWLSFEIGVILNSKIFYFNLHRKYWLFNIFTISFKYDLYLCTWFVLMYLLTDMFIWYAQHFMYYTMKSVVTF